MVVASPDVYVFPPALDRVRELLSTATPSDQLAAEFVEYAKRVSECVHKTLARAAETAWARTKPDDDGTQDQLRALVKQAAVVGRDVLARVGEGPAAVRMRHALEVLAVEQRNIVTGWPEWVSREEVMADIRAGRFEPVEVAFARLAGMSVEDWERYVADVKARRGVGG